MSHHVIGFAESLLSSDPRPSSLSTEKILSHLVLFSILVQVILIGYILIDDFVCFDHEVNVVEALESPLPSHSPVEEYVSLVCGTEIRRNAWLFFVEKTFFLFFFVAIFYFNKVFVSNINRYHTILNREKIERYITTTPVYTNVDYKRRWWVAIVAFCVYKLVAVVVFVLVITGALLIINLADDVSDLLRFEGVKCGPDMRSVPNLGTEFTCHFEHEYLIHVLSILSTTLAFVDLLLLVVSTVGLLVYARKFHSHQDRRQYLDEELIGYEVVGTLMKD